MKIRILLTAALMLFAIAGCDNAAKDGEGEKGTDNTETTTPDLGGTYKAVPAKSSITWTGTKADATGAHNGKISLKDGSLELDKEGYLTGGKFSIDMLSLINTDEMPANKKADLENHLKSAEYFDSENFTTATYTITGVTRGAEAGKYDVKGQLALRDMSKDISFPATVGKTGEEVNASGNISLTQDDFGLAKWAGTIDLAVMVVANK
jgi:polyisoprenoid-binding protein YceI